MSLTIGQIAAAASVNIQTVRYYERRGLLSAPRRSPSGYRQYDNEAVKRLRFIKQAQLLGFSLQEIKELLALRVRHGAACETIERKTRDKIALTDGKLRELQRLKNTLDDLAASCRARKATAECPVLEALEEDDATILSDTSKSMARPPRRGTR